MIDAIFPRRNLPWVQNTIFFSLTAMEMAWFTPLMMVFLPETWHTPPLLLLMGLWALMAGLLVIAHFLEQQAIASPAFELIVAGLLIVLGLTAIRLFVYTDEPLLSLRWLPRLLIWDEKALQSVVILATLGFLWWRAVTFLQREINFFIIGYDFRKGVLALIATVSFFHALSSQSGLIFVYVFFFFGLLAVALGRAEDKARTTGDGRAPIHRQWLTVIGLSTLAVTGIAWLFGQLWSLSGFAALWRLLTPALGWMAPYAEAAILFFLRLLNPLLEWLISLIKGAVNGKAGEETLQNLTKNMPSADKVMGESQTVYTPPAWLMIFLNDILPLLIGLVVLLALAFWLVKRRRNQQMALLEEDHVTVESLEREGFMNALRRGFDRLKDLAGMIGQFGAGKSLYAAISIRHIYANVQKLAAKRGYPRDIAWTPNDYLPFLMQAFPGHEADLRHITELYNAYEYGHVSTDSEELQRLRAAWEALQHTPPPETTATASP